MATKQRSKRENQIAHTQQRLFERYGILASKAEIGDIVTAIQSGRGKCVERQSLRVSVWDVVVHEQTVRVVYDKERKTIATALPK